MTPTTDNADSKKPKGLRRAFFLSFLQSYSSAIIDFVGVMILSRLLTPTEIGIYTVGIAVVGISHIFRDFGVNQYIVQEKKLSKEKVASAFGITIAFAWCIGVALYSTAPQIAEFYQEDAVEGLLYIVGLNFFIIPFGALGPALLRRSMSFGTLMKINLSATVVRTLVSVGLALFGFGFISLAWGSVAGVTISALLAQYYLPKKHRVWPSLLQSRAILSFGAHIVGAGIAREVSSKGLELLVGKTLGFYTLGILSKGSGYTKIYENIIAKAVRPVVSSKIAEVNRTSGNVTNIYYDALNFITLTAWFSLGFLGLMSADLVRLLFGEQWNAAIPVASLFCMLACIGIVSQLVTNLFVATGRAKTNFWVAITMTALRLIVMLLTVEHGLHFMILCFIPVGVFRGVVCQLLAAQYYGIKISRVLTIMLSNFLIVISALLGPAYLFYFGLEEWTLWESIFRLVCGGGCSAISLIALSYTFKHPISKEINNFATYLSGKLKFG